MDNNLVARNQELFVQMLQIAGFGEKEIQEILTGLNKKMNTAIIEDIFSALSPMEQEKLEKTLKNINTSDVTAVTKSLQEAALNSQNKVDADEVAIKARVKVWQDFMLDLNKRLSEEQKRAIATLFQEEMKTNSEYKQYMEQILQQLMKGK